MTRKNKVPANLSRRACLLSLLSVGFLQAQGSTPSESEKVVLDIKASVVRAWDETSETRARLWADIAPFLEHAWSDLGPLVVPAGRFLGAPGLFVYSKLQLAIDSWQDILAITLISYWFWRPALRLIGRTVASSLSAGSKWLEETGSAISDRVGPLIRGLGYVLEPKADRLGFDLAITFIGSVVLKLGVGLFPHPMGYVAALVAMCIFFFFARHLVRGAIGAAREVQRKRCVPEHPYHIPTVALIMIGACIVWPILGSAALSPSPASSPAPHPPSAPTPLIVLIAQVLISLPFIPLILLAVMALWFLGLGAIFVALTSLAPALYFGVYWAARA